MVLFANGWQKFVEDNYVEPEDSLVFSYDGDNMFDVLIFEKSGCEKRETSATVSIDMDVNMEEKEDDEDDIVVIEGVENDGDEDYFEEEEEGEEATHRGKKTGGNNGGSKRRAPVNVGLPKGVDASSYVEPQNPDFVPKKVGDKRNYLVIISAHL
ncbi:putative B3 domain-containing protein Os03g0621600 [Pistacia vera]|uniref:putative B3 domain-containing protein Os03g0621600 n=1 Tax=Pistacia vera TaxID=55513 RepID=UPI0012631D13|nr:putative B3 domain-containing protein Os03g0621600 [Pistacia vera]